MNRKLMDVAEFEVERERDLLDNSKYFRQTIQQIEEMAAPGTLMCHEVVHMAYVLHTMVLSQLSEHPSILCNKAWYIKSRQIAYLLHELHTDILIEHEEEEDDE